MVGGLIVSQALTLFTTPVIYRYLDQLPDWISSWRSADRKEDSHKDMKAAAAPGAD